MFIVDILNYPKCFTIPSETKIKQEIDRLFSKSKDTGTTRRKNSRCSDRNTNNVIVNWQTVVEDMVSKEVLEKP